MAGERPTQRASNFKFTCCSAVVQLCGNDDTDAPDAQAAALEREEEERKRFERASGVAAVQSLGNIDYSNMLRTGAGPDASDAGAHATADDRLEQSGPAGGQSSWTSFTTGLVVIHPPDDATPGDLGPDATWASPSAVLLSFVATVGADLDLHDVLLCLQVT
jgi:hypothetical protein